MLTVSVHGIRFHSRYGLYPQEAILDNEFEVDVDIVMEVQEGQPWPFADYTFVHKVVLAYFDQPGELLEAAVEHIHGRLKQEIAGARSVKVCVRKLAPPMAGDVRYAQVCYEA